jgi:hypothetical protein
MVDGPAEEGTPAVSTGGDVVTDVARADNAAVGAGAVPESADWSLGSAGD